MKTPARDLSTFAFSAFSVLAPLQKKYRESPFDARHADRVKRGFYVGRHGKNTG